MKIYNVFFNDGGWHESMPSCVVVAENKEEAESKALEEHPVYKYADVFASEFKIDGYIIEVYDEKTYNREKNLEKLV